MKKTTVNKYLGSYTVSTSSGGGGTGGTTDYSALTNKPQIGGVELTGNKSLSDLGIQPTGDYALTSAIPTKVSQLQNDSNFLTSIPTASTTTLGGVKVDGTTITATAEGVISAPVADTPVATTETAGIVKPSSLTFDVEEDGTLVNKVAGSNCYIYGLKGIGSDDITIAADTTTTIPVGRLRNYDYEKGDRLKVGDMLIDLKGNVAKVDRVNTAVLPAGSGPFGVNESSVLVQLQTREDDTLTTSSKEVVGAINELKTSTDSKLNKPASYAQADLPDASEHFGEFAIVTDLENALVWSNGTAWKQITLTDLA